jgi:predicted MFS family arabinose efflux permease
MVVLITFGGIVGTRLTPTPALATLPLSLAIVGVAAASIPAAMAMQRFGRRPMFVAAALGGAVAALSAAWGIATGDFTLFCVSGLLFGANAAFVQQYRFAATEYVEVDAAPRAVAIVMWGTLAAAVIGPEIADRTRLIGGANEFTGSFVAVAVLLVSAALILRALGPPQAHATESIGRIRPLGEIVRQPPYAAAVIVSVASYAAMSFIMTATPISMHVIDGLSVGETKRVISSHLLAMYLPSLVSGWLVARFGLARMMLAGIALMAVCIVISSVTSHAFVHYFSALVLLGIGWNLMFIAATALLTRSYLPAERFRAQGLNDFATFGTQAIVSLAAGASIEAFGWRAVNLATLPILALAVAAVLVWRVGERRQAVKNTASSLASASAPASSRSGPRSA